jgi:hypothetical protein
MLPDMTATIDLEEICTLASSPFHPLLLGSALIEGLLSKPKEVFTNNLRLKDLDTLRTAVKIRSIDS